MSKKKTSRSRREKLLHDRLMRRVYAQLRRPDLRIRLADIRKTGGDEGMTMGDDTVVIDHRSEIPDVLVHECLHLVFPDATEKEVEKLEDRLIARITPRQTARLLRLMVARLK